MLCAALFGLLALGVLIFSVTSIALDNQGTKNPLDNPLLPSLGVSAILTILCGSIALCPLILRYRKPQAFLDRPFVLFLRRFSTFSDRAVIALILKQATTGVPIVFLTPTLSRPGDWDPFVVSFAGLKLRHPLQSIPIILRASDDYWQAAAEELIRRARRILLDISQPSDALQTEAEMIDSADRWADTVCLRLSVHKTGLGGDSFSDSVGVHVIEYTKSWVRALPRMAMGLVVVLLAVLFLFDQTLFLMPESLLPHVLTFFFIASVNAYTYYSVFVRPTINKEAKKALRMVLGPGN
jgi:hypothetical protein